MGNTLRRVLVPFLLWPLAGCLPSYLEASGAVLLTSPVVLGIAGLLLMGLLAVWRPVHPDLRIPWRLHAMIGGISILGGLLALALQGEQEDVSEWILAALILFGSTFVGLFLLIWRIALFIDPLEAARRATLWTSVLLVGPAFLGLVARPSSADAVIILWVAPGIYGIFPLLMLIILFVEAAIRRKSALTAGSKPSGGPRPTPPPDYYGPS